MGLVVNATPRPLDPRERRGTHCIGGWVGPRAGLENFAPLGIRSPDRSARSESQYRLNYPSPLIYIIYIYFFFFSTGKIKPTLLLGPETLLALSGATWSLLGSPRNGQAMLYPF